MSKVKIQGNASGTGIFTVAAPATNTDRTLTLPDVDATVMTTAGGTFTNQLIISEGTFGSSINLNNTGTGGKSFYIFSTSNVFSQGGGNLMFHHNDSPGGLMKIDSSGRITTPYQPFARVYRRSGSNPTLTNGQTIVFNNADANVGNCYSTSTGRFTCPASGTYIMMSKIELNSGAGDWAYNYGAHKNGSNIAGVFEAKISASYWAATSMAIIECNANDYLEFKISTNITIQNEDNPGDVRNFAMFYKLG